MPGACSKTRGTGPANAPTGLGPQEAARAMMARAGRWVRPANISLLDYSTRTWSTRNWKPVFEMRCSRTASNNQAYVHRPDAHAPSQPLGLRPQAWGQPVGRAVTGPARSGLGHGVGLSMVSPVGTGDFV